MKQTYKKNFLSDVIFKINFPAFLELVEDIPKEFQKGILDDFPILEPTQALSIKFVNEPNIPQSKLEKKTIWLFRNKEKNSAVELDFNSLAVTTNKYNNFSDFKDIISKVINAFFNVYNTTIINRLGLRYVNQINLDEKNFFDWSNYINEDLIKSINFFEDKGQIRRTMHTSELFFEEDNILRFNYGIFNSVYPNKIVKKEFLLDYDCYTENQLENEKILTKLDKYNEIITKYYEKSITDNFRKILNE